MFFADPGPPNGKKGATRTGSKSEDRWQTALSLLEKGQFRRAADLLEPIPAAAEMGKSPHLRWRQLRQESALLADLSAEPLEDLLRHAAASAPEEWQAECRRRYRGKAFVFDARFERRTGGWVTDYGLATDQGEKVRVLWDDLSLFEKIPDSGPRRLILGARLESLDLEPPGPVWTLRWQPDSGILLTSAPALRNCCPELEGPELEALVRDQFQWATGLAGHQNGTRLLD